MSLMMKCSLCGGRGVVDISPSNEVPEPPQPVTFGEDPVEALEALSSHHLDPIARASLELIRHHGQVDLHVVAAAIRAYSGVLIRYRKMLGRAAEVCHIDQWSKIAGAK